MQNLNNVYDNTKTYYGIDIFKFICAFLVIAIHIHPLKSFNGLLDFGLSFFICLIAVPYFFTASGFLLSRKIYFNNFSKSVTISYALKIYRLYIIWSIIYFPINLIDNILKCKDGIVHGLINYFHDFIFLGSYSHLWYLNALAFSVLLLTLFLYKKIKDKTIIVISLFFYLLGLLAQAYFVITKGLMQIHYVDYIVKIFKSTFVTTRNGLFFGFVFVVIGMIIFKYGKTISLKSSVFGFVVSFVFYSIEVLIVTKLNWAHYTEMYLFLLPVVAFLFLISIKIEVPSSKIWNNLRYTGVLIYFIHLLVKRVLIVFMDPLLGNNRWYPLILFVLVSLVSFALSEAIIQLSKSNSFKWLEKIYK